MVTPADLPEIKALLSAAARAGRDLSYSEMLLALGYRFSRPKLRSLCRLWASGPYARFLTQQSTTSKG